MRREIDASLCLYILSSIGTDHLPLLSLPPSTPNPLKTLAPNGTSSFTHSPPSHPDQHHPLSYLVFAPRPGLAPFAPNDTGYEMYRLSSATGALELVAQTTGERLQPFTVPQGGK